MKKLLLLALLIFPLVANAQKIKIDEIDKMEGFRHIRTSEENIFNSTFKNPFRLWMEVGAIVDGDVKLLSLDFATDVENSVFEGNKIVFLFENGEKVELFAKNSYILDHFYAKIAGVSQEFFGVSPSYTLLYDSPELKKLIENTITDIRIEFKDSYRDYPVNKKGYEKIKKCITLVLDRMNK